MGLLLMAPSLSLLAADAPLVKLDEPAQRDKNRFGLSYRAGFGINAEFKNVGNVARGGDGAGRDPGPATGSGVDRFYDDGYNRVDISGNQGGLTWFWGYKNSSQISGSDTIEMHSTTVAPIDSGKYDNDPQHGFELTYNRELGRGRNGKWAWGVEGGFGWTDVRIHDRRALAGGVTVITDSYSLGGVNPNVPPFSSEYPGHAGTYEGPGALIEDAPTRTVSSDRNGAAVEGERNFDGDLFSFRVGPYIDLPLDDDWTISFSAGFAAGVIDGEYSFDQNVTTVGGTVRQTGSGSNTEALFGGYASATIRYAINQQWGLFVSGQYVGLANCYEAEANGQSIELNLTRTGFVSVGVTYSF